MRHKTGLIYELVPGHCPGPKRNAIIEFNKFTVVPILEDAFIDHLHSNYCSSFNSIQWARFYSFHYTSRGTEEKFRGRLRIALLNTEPDPRARQELFEHRSKITQATGWYPLVMGTRARFATTATSKYSLEPIGDLQGFSPIANSFENGVSFELHGANGKYLFDFGFNGCKKDDHKAYFISHSHSDHAGGFENTLLNNSSSVPIYTFGSKHSYSFLRNRIRNTQLHDYLFFADTNFQNRLQLNDGSQVHLFPVFHTPGALGFQVTDRRKFSFFYLGDMCLKNGYSDFSKKIARTLSEHKTDKNVLLLDACMLGRSDSIEETDTPETILREFSGNVSRRNVIFFSNQPENSIYSFLKVFHITQKDVNLRPIKLIVSESLSKALSFLIEPAIFKIDSYKDPVYNSLFGGSGSNPVESQRLYPLTSEVLGTIGKDERCIIFAGIKDLDFYPELCNRLEKADIILSGTFAMREELPRQLAISKPRSMIRVASADWSFHSTERDLFEFIRGLAAPDFIIYLFHNYRKRISNSLSKNGIDQTYVKVLGEGEFISFGSDT